MCRFKHEVQVIFAGCSKSTSKANKVYRYKNVTLLSIMHYHNNKDFAKLFFFPMGPVICWRCKYFVDIYLQTLISSEGKYN